METKTFSHAEKTSAKMFARQEASSNSIDYVKKFRSLHQTSPYQPHVTIGFGDLKTMRELCQHFKAPEHIESNRVVFTQLGQHCTVSAVSFFQWNA